MQALTNVFSFESTESMLSIFWSRGMFIAFKFNIKILTMMLVLYVLLIYGDKHEGPR